MMRSTVAMPTEMRSINGLRAQSTPRGTAMTAAMTSVSALTPRCSPTIWRYSAPCVEKYSMIACIPPLL